MARRHIESFGWAAADGSIGMMINVLTLAIVARALGPSDYGVYAYVFSLAAILAAFGYLGLDNLVVKRLVESPAARHTVVLGSSFFIRTIGFLVGALALVLFGSLFGHHSSVEEKVFWAAGLFLAMQPLGAICLFWHRSRGNLKPASLASIGSNSVGALLKIGSLWLGFGVVFLSYIQVASALLLSLAVYALLAWCGGPRIGIWRVSRCEVRSLLSSGSSLYFAGLISVFASQLDIPLLRFLAGGDEVGQYALAARIVALTSVYSTALSLTIFPMFVRFRSSNKREGNDLSSFAFAVSALGGYLFVYAWLLFGKDIIFYVVGDSFSYAADISTVLVLNVPLMFCRAVFFQWAIANEKNKLLIYREVFALLLLVTFGWYLIPSEGGRGAAYAVLASSLLSSLLPFFFDSSSRGIVKAQLYSMFFPFGPIWRMVKRKRDLLLRL